MTVASAGVRTDADRMWQLARRELREGNAAFAGQERGAARRRVPRHRVPGFADEGRPRPNADASGSSGGKHSPYAYAVGRLLVAVWL